MEDSLKNYDDCLYSISIFSVELQLDVVLEVLLVVRFEFLVNPVELIQKEDSLKTLGWLIYKWRRCFTFQQLKKNSYRGVWGTKKLWKT